MLTCGSLKLCYGNLGNADDVSTIYSSTRKFINDLKMLTADMIKGATSRPRVAEIFVDCGRFVAKFTLSFEQKVIFQPHTGKS